MTITKILARGRRGISFVSGSGAGSEADAENAARNAGGEDESRQDLTLEECSDKGKSIERVADLDQTVPAKAEGADQRLDLVR
jgi:hypothetical protein